MDMKMRKQAASVAIAVLFFGAIYIAPSQADVATDVATYMEEARQGRSSTVLNETRQKAPRPVLLELGKYLKSEERQTRFHAVWMIGGTGRMQASRPVRQLAAQLLFGVAVGDTDEGVAGAAAESLLGYSAGDFSDEMRQEMHAYLDKNRTLGKPISTAVQLAGVMAVTSAVEMLRELAAVPRGSHWTAVLALARMGYPTAIQHVVAKVGNSSDVERLSALHDLVFIRQPQGVEVLVRVLFSEDTYGNGTDVPMTKYARRSVDLLAQIIEGFPITATGTSSTKEELETARQWVIAQGGAANLKIKR
jgi:hypothetical protein